MQFRGGAHYVCVGRNSTTLNKPYHALCILCLLTSYHSAGSQKNRCPHLNVQYPTVKKTNFMPVTNTTKDLLNSSTKAGNLRRGVFWLEVEHTVLSIHHLVPLVASSRGLHYLESNSPIKSPLNTNSSSSICKF